MEPNHSNPVETAQTTVATLRATGVTPDWALALVATYNPQRPAAWTPRERRRWRWAWALLRP
jgi:hypothetical protein